MLLEWKLCHNAMCRCRWHAEVVAARDDITRLMTLESGKPLAESRGEFDNGWVVAAYTAGVPMTGVCCGLLLAVVQVLVPLPHLSWSCVDRCLVTVGR
jgi:hypothetical protein